LSLHPAGLIAVVGLVTLLLGGCVIRRPETGVFDAEADSRLATTVRHGLFVTSVRIGGREVGPFVIDSGSDSLFLDTELAQRLQARVLDAHSEGAYQRTPSSSSTATIGDLTVGPVTLRNPLIRIVDLSLMTPGFGERLAGVLGYPFFASAVVEVDYVRRSVSCFDPARYQLPRGAWQPLDLRGQLPGIPVRMNDGAEGVFLLDTGSNNTANLFPHFVAKHPQLKIQNIRPHKNLGVAGERDVQVGRIGWLELGGRRVERPWVILEKAGAPHGKVAWWFDGLVGEGALRQFLVVFNYPDAKIALLPASASRPVSQWKVRPPSTASAAPVTKDDSSLVR
jgi:Aspartyl protease